MRDVRIVLAPVGGTFDVFFERRTRQTFRQWMTDLGGISNSNSDSAFKNFPLNRLPEVKEVIASSYPTWDVEVTDNRAVIKRPEDKIAWARVFHTSGRGFGSTINHYGYIGRRRVFEIQRTITRRDQPAKFDLIWEFGSSTLATSDSEETLEIFAERHFDRFLTSLGAKFVGTM